MIKLENQLASSTRHSSTASLPYRWVGLIDWRHLMNDRLLIDGMWSLNHSSYSFTLRDNHLFIRSSSSSSQQSTPVMGKSKSWFDLNHDWITGDDLICDLPITGALIYFPVNYYLCAQLQYNTFGYLAQLPIRDRHSVLKPMTLTDAYSGMWYRNWYILPDSYIIDKTY